MLVLLIALSACATAPKAAYGPPVHGTVTSGYGQRGKGFHHGIDIAAQRGARVRAVQDGRVTFVGRKKGFGRLVIVDHGGGVESYYAHLSGYSTRKGRRVKRGQPVGKVGSSGRASGPHLHFELRQGGASVNPVGTVPVR